MRGRVALLIAAATAFAASALAISPAVPQPRDAVIAGEAMPRDLAAFGFFNDTRNQLPAPGVVPYRLNTALWSDGSEKLRFVYVPPGKQAKATSPDENGGLLDFPVGSALIKTFAYTENGKRRLIETRLLLHRAGGWVALPYLWNAEQTEARLALAGARVPVTTPAGQAISYRVPNKNQCKECHGLDGKVVPIGPKARNLSHEWLAGFAKAGLLDAAPKVADPLPLWEKRAGATAEAAARAHLDVNCAHCHRPGATASNSGLDLRWEQTDPKALGVMKRPVAAGRGAGSFLYDIVPGHPEQSILTHRMGSLEGGVAMPELGKATLDREGIEAAERWIASMPR